MTLDPKLESWATLRDSPKIAYEYWNLQMKEKISQLTLCAVLLSSLFWEIKPAAAQLVLPGISPSPTVKKSPAPTPSPEAEKPAAESKAFDLAIKDAEKSEGLFILENLTPNLLVFSFLLLKEIKIKTF